MKKILAIALTMALLMVPVLSFAEEAAAAPNGKLTTFQVSNFSLDMGDGAEHVIDVTLQPVWVEGAGEGRGAAGLYVYGGEDLAGMLMASLENGEVRAYLNGMSSYIAVPLEQLESLMQQSVDISGTANGETQTMDTKAVEKFCTAYIDYMKKMSDKQYITDMMIKELQLFESDMGMVKGAAEEVDLLDGKRTLNRYDVTLTLEQCFELFDKLKQADPDYQAMIDVMKEYYAMLGMGNAFSAEGLRNLGVSEMTAKITLWTDAETLDQEPHAMRMDLEMAVSAKIGTDADTQSAEPETLTMTIPYTISYLNDETGTYAYFQMTMEPEADQTAAMDMSYSAPATDADGTQTQSATVTMAFDMYGEQESVFLDWTQNKEADASQTTTLLMGETHASGDNTMTLAYTSKPVEAQGTLEATQGAASAWVVSNEAGQTVFNGGITFDTRKTVIALDAGELLSIDLPAVNPFELDEDGMNSVMSDAMSALMSGTNVLMQADGVSDLLQMFSASEDAGIEGSVEEGVTEEDSILEEDVVATEEGTAAEEQTPAA